MARKKPNPPKLAKFRSGLKEWQPDHFVCDDDSYCHMREVALASPRYLELCKETTALLMRLITREELN